MLTSFSFTAWEPRHEMSRSIPTCHQEPTAVQINALFRKAALGCSLRGGSTQDPYTGRSMNEMREIKRPNRDGANRQVKHSGSGASTGEYREF